MKRLVMTIDEATLKEIKIQAVREGCGYRDLIKRCFSTYMEQHNRVHEDESKGVE